MKSFILFILIFVCAFGFAVSGELLGDRHLHQFGLKCNDCHTETPPSVPVKMAKCLECHESYDALAKLTDKDDPNPHKNHITDDGINCSECHRSHKPPVLICDSCHQFNLNVR